MSSSSRSSTDSDGSLAEVIASIDLDVVAQIAKGKRRGWDFLLEDDLRCQVVTPPSSGSANLVYELKFNDGGHWAFRIPHGDWDDNAERSMVLDITTQRFIASKIPSFPIPQIRGYLCDGENRLGHPFMITDFVSGTKLIEVWNDPSWWTGGRTRENTLRSIAKHMAQLASLEFDQIGSLQVHDDGSYHIGPFPALRKLLPDHPDGDAPFGPFSSTRAFMFALLEKAREVDDTSSLSLLELLLGALPEHQFDGPPFHLSYPDFDSQNVFVDDKGEVSGFIDWDGVDVSPRQLAALVYPSWLTVDWDPVMYDLYMDQPNCDSEDELHRLRGVYVDALDEVSEGRFGAVARNSHVVQALYGAIAQRGFRFSIVHHLAKYVFGSESLALEVEDAVEQCPRFHKGSSGIARVEKRDINNSSTDELASLKAEEPQGVDEGNKVLGADAPAEVKSTHADQP
ncbi:kinase-like protein [Schizophyllum commune H4-8]|uniref:kinase-like protein n=1 Tax=Schizophyllum commune (strain H4-8 / FGSC 9210) TaxID=578458 RepID=UPI00215F400E|nr:kinase-like protein [Schizophyllum commune H4-8]KAI5888576.1 kinase-like protein [Schizophyllum commune H4-8]